MTATCAAVEPLPFRGQPAAAMAVLAFAMAVGTGCGDDGSPNEGRDTPQLGATGRAIVVSGAGHGDIVADHPQLTGRIASFLRDSR